MGDSISQNRKITMEKDREEFEKWAESVWDVSVVTSPEMSAALEAWEGRQPEIDALKVEVQLAQTSERKAAENNVKLIEENLRLKAENERLRKDADRLTWLEENPRLGEIHVDGEVKETK